MKSVNSAFRTNRFMTCEAEIGKLFLCMVRTRINKRIRLFRIGVIGGLRNRKGRAIF